MGRKYAVLCGDGMADYPIPELQGKTPLQAAETPNLDRMAQKGVLGLVRPAPPAMPPGSDVANRSIFGYDPALHFTGRAPLEAAAMGVKLNPEDVAFRCNLVTLGSRNGRETMDDFSAGHISTGEAREIIQKIGEIRGNDGCMATCCSREQVAPRYRVRQARIRTHWRSCVRSFALGIATARTHRPLDSYLAT